MWYLSGDGFVETSANSPTYLPMTGDPLGVEGIMACVSTFLSQRHIVRRDL